MSSESAREGVRMRGDHEFELPFWWRGAEFWRDDGKEPGARPHPREPFVLRRIRKAGKGEALGIWSTESGALVRFLPELLDAAWTPDGGGLLCASARRHVEVELLSFPALASVRRARLAFDTGAGVGGGVLAVSDGGRFAALELHSGQSQEGYAAFTLPGLVPVAALPYVGGEAACPCAFSPDERWMAFVHESTPIWWVGEDDDDPDWNTPAKGGRVCWATLALEDLHRPGARSDHPILVEVPKGWFPPPELEGQTWPRRVRFEGAGSLWFDLPWGGSARLAIPPPGPCVVQGPKR